PPDPQIAKLQSQVEELTKQAAAASSTPTTPQPAAPKEAEASPPIIQFSNKPEARAALENLYVVLTKQVKVAIDNLNCRNFSGNNDQLRSQARRRIYDLASRPVPDGLPKP